MLGGRYKLLASIGHGASGDVYLAVDSNLSRAVAIKLLHSQLASDRVFLQRFRAEAKAAAALSNPSIMSVYDWGESLTGPYLVVELLSGGSLREHLSSGFKPSPSQVVQIALQCVSGLRYAHKYSYIHRDLKPANLIFDEGGHIKIADFGLARTLAEPSWSEPKGVLLGTAKYASPEQANGETALKQSDIYSLGLILYEMVAGTLPFDGKDTFEILRARLKGDVEPPDGSGVLEPILRRSLRRDPMERYDAEELLAELLVLSRSLEPAEPIVPLHREEYKALRERGTPISPVIDIDDGDTQLAGSVGFPSRDLKGEVPTVYDGELDVSTTTFALGSDSISTMTVVDGSIDVAGDLSSSGIKEQARRSKGRSLRGWRGLVMWIVVTVFLSAATFAAASLYQSATSATVPSVMGLTPPQATSAIAKVGLKALVSGKAYSPTVPIGLVLSEFPKPGSKISKNVEVDLTLSAGPAPVPVPGVVGATQATAEQEITADHLHFIVQSAYSSTVKSGDVISTTPAPQRLAPYGSNVTLVVSKGPAPVAVPNVVGESQQAATSALTADQLSISSTTAYSNTVPTGEIISQGVAPGAMVLPGTTVPVVVSLGPQYVTVPNVLDDTLSQAQQALQGAGLQVGNVYGPKNAKVVIFTNPTLGTQVLYGSSVDLYMA
ncbi:serine/threonine protein kinase [Ferrithrix thermotolerans DSM 19514]|uniref:non-specific serine/threonine protein kinase n=1 Tax=Ferrithrix thermotolerans DSM 19514 TaxID=1121881 RepID=A0A1M4XV51_9ACTN|nr:Stk1 family PASTA domain-containing Ser/Thr kinase [Ferrithrix thermotolerans]SHE97295.1 serine/threonine protein kinase [Ferrithrix thermotolerans DSM 19514]